MGVNVVQGAVAQCSFGLAPTTLNVLPVSRVTIEGRPAAVITDTVTGVNLPPFGMCSSLANPTVAAATAAARGGRTPMACVATGVAPWAPLAPRTVIGGQPALVSGSVCTCAFGGVITLLVPGAVRTTAN